MFFAKLMACQLRGGGRENHRRTRENYGSVICMYDGANILALPVPRSGLGRVEQSGPENTTLGALSLFLRYD
jgi:hypothetical protein